MSPSTAHSDNTNLRHVGKENSKPLIGSMQKAFCWFLQSVNQTWCCFRGLKIVIRKWMIKHEAGRKTGRFPLFQWLWGVLCVSRLFDVIRTCRLRIEWLESETRQMQVENTALIFMSNRYDRYLYTNGFFTGILKFW